MGPINQLDLNQLCKFNIKSVLGSGKLRKIEKRNSDEFGDSGKFFDSGDLVKGYRCLC